MIYMIRCIIPRLKFENLHYSRSTLRKCSSHVAHPTFINVANPVTSERIPAQKSKLGFLCSGRE